MTARGEMVKAAGLTNPNPETAVTASAAADAAPERRTRQFICYWRQSQAVPLSSDGSSNVLQVWAMLHGNLLRSPG
jgi:hypothetical protein